MNKETFLLKKAALEAQIEQLTKDYIEANKPYQKGQRLKLIEGSKETIAEVSYCLKNMGILCQCVIKC